MGVNQPKYIYRIIYDQLVKELTDSYRYMGKEESVWMKKKRCPKGKKVISPEINN